MYSRLNFAFEPLAATGLAQLTHLPTTLVPYKSCFICRLNNRLLCSHKASMRRCHSTYDLLQVWCDTKGLPHTVRDQTTEEFVRYICREANVGCSKKPYSFKTCEMIVLALRDYREYLISTGALRHDEVSCGL